jgi:hypothetical protein
VRLRRGSNAQAPRRGLVSRRILTCSGMPVATHWPTRGTTRGRCRLTSAIATFSTRCATLSFHRCVSGISGGLSPLSAEACSGGGVHEPYGEPISALLPKGTSPNAVVMSALGRNGHRQTLFDYLVGIHASVRGEKNGFSWRRERSAPRPYPGPHRGTNHCSGFFGRFGVHKHDIGITASRGIESLARAAGLCAISVHNPGINTLTWV